jgi:hypothetical protein
MIVNKELAQIKEFILDNESAYQITYEHSIWSVIVSRESGLITFLKGGILPESVDKFEASYDGSKTEIYLHSTDKYGSHRAYIGETEDHQAAMYWVRKVNQFYANLKVQDIAKAAD